MQTLKKILLGLSSIVVLASCKKEYSTDLPLNPKLTPSLFVVNNNNSILSLDPNTGSKKWESRVGANVVANPLILNDKLIVVDVQGSLNIINRIDGKVERTIPLGSMVVGTPIIVDGKLAVAVGNTVKMFDPNLDFGQVWQFSSSAPIKTSLAVNTIGSGTEKQVFFAAGASVYAIKVSNGLLTWKSDVVGAGDFNSSVCAANSNYLYVGNDNGNLYALNTVDGSVFWAYSTGAPILSSPISVGGNIMVGGSDRVFYSVDSATGLLRWKVTAEDRIISSPVVKHPYVYFGSNDFNVYSINIIDGTLKWKQLTLGTITNSPLVFNDVVYINGHDNNIYALDATTGEQKWIKNVNAYMTASMVYDNLTEVIYPSISGNNPQ